MIYSPWKHAMLEWLMVNVLPRSQGQTLELNVVEFSFTHVYTVMNSLLRPSFEGAIAK